MLLHELSLSCDKWHLQPKTLAQAHVGTHSWACAQHLQCNGIYSLTLLEMYANVSQRTLNQRQILKCTMWGKEVQY